MPDDIDDEELQSYAEEHAALADFADIDLDEFTSLSDLDEECEGEARRQNQVDDMDIS